MNAVFPPRIEHTRLTQHVTSLGLANDLVARNGWLYGISSAEGGSFWICDIRGEYADEPKKVAEIKGLGNMRQIEISDTAVPGKCIAAITARECGAYFMDVTIPEKPRLLCHYNTVEMATGVAIYGQYAFIGNRNFGVEIMDISDPSCPRHCSAFSAGEVQSLYVSDGILYTGSWGERQVWVFDVHDVCAPKKLSVIPLEGRADGLTVQNGILYAAYGQHRPPATGLNPNEYGYGRGNGFSIWDVSDPAAPRRLSTTFFPYQYFCAYWDMWDVALSSHYAIVSHTFNGVWIYDITDLTAPALVDHTAIRSEFPVEEMIVLNEITTKVRPTIFPFDMHTNMYAPVNGVALGAGRMYIASRFAHLHIAKGEYFAEETGEKETPLQALGNFYERFPGEDCQDVVFAPTPGQAHAVILANGVVWAACGMDGIRVYDPDDLSLLAHIPMEKLWSGDAFAMDIREINGLFLIAAGRAGVLFCRAEGYQLVRIGHCHIEDRSCAQAVPSANGRFAMVHADDQTLVILHIADPASPRILMKECYQPGAIYHRQISYRGVGGRYYGCFWNANWTHWYDLGGDEPILTPWTNGRLNGSTGIIGLDEPYMALALHNDGYVIHDIREHCEYGNKERIHPPEFPFRGKPNIQGSILCATDRPWRRVILCDIADRNHPRLLRQVQFTGNPDMGCFTEKGVVIPLGHQGIALIPYKKAPVPFETELAADEV